MEEENISYSSQSVSGCPDYETCNHPKKNETNCRGLTYLFYKSMKVCETSKGDNKQ